MKIPNIPNPTPNTTLMKIDVCVAREAFSLSPAPIDLATTTPAPTDIPISTLTIRFISDPVDPTAASDVSLPYFPTTTISAALYRS